MEEVEDMKDKEDKEAVMVVTEEAILDMVAETEAPEVITMVVADM